MESSLAERALIAQQVDEHGIVTGPDLFQKQRVHHLRGTDHMRQGAALGGRQRR